MRIIGCIALFIYSSLTWAQVLPDSVWTDSRTGDKMHYEPVSLTDTVVKIKPKPLLAFAEGVAINAGVLSWDYFLFDNRNWAKVTMHSIRENLKGSWEWDDDSFSGNQFSHPFHGSLFYNAARENGLSYGQSLIYPLIGSTVWELFCENNHPAINDFFSTGIGGSAIGEATHRISDLVFDNSKTGASRIFREVAGSLLNPVRGAQRLFSGDMFRVDHNNRGKREAAAPYHFEVGFGDRHIAETGTPHPEHGRKHSEHIPFIDFTLAYGDHFNHLDGGRTKPFDQFNIHALLNVGNDQPTFSALEINGRIFSSQHSAPHNWLLDWGLYQNYKYIDNYWKGSEMRPGNLPLMSEAASFGGGLYAEHEGKTTLSNLLLISAVPMGCSTADYYTSPNLFGITELPNGKNIGKRRYNYGMGFSIRDNLEVNLNKTITWGNRFYFMQLYSWTGYDPENVTFFQSGVMGDKGHQSILTDTFFAHIHCTKNLKLKLEYQHYHRYGKYNYYPSLKAKSHEMKATLAYSI